VPSRGIGYRCRWPVGLNRLPLRMAETVSAFLTAEWRFLAMLTFPVDPSLLQPFVPRGTEIDTHDGRSLISLVGFRFLRTRVLGYRVPFHQDFDEVNLRFYVRREVRGELRRGVTFIREIVPRRLIAFVARLVYNEPYIALPMQSEVAPGPRPNRVRYAWRSARGWQHLALITEDELASRAGQSDVTFITDHQWGYSRQRDGTTLEYRVEHPPWRVWIGAQPEVMGDLGVVYGSALGSAIAGAPVSALLAEGSPVTVYRPLALTAP
jgi:uncharacterized protein YqjF (DUF2071 family)